MPLGEFRQPGATGWNRRRCKRALPGEQFGKVWLMLGKIAGAWIGSKMAGRDQGMKGALIGAGVASLARRGLGPLAAAAAAAYGAKKLWDWSKDRNRGRSYPSEATPSPPSG